jgi:hypothetical protein
MSFWAIQEVVLYVRSYPPTNQSFPPDGFKRQVHEGERAVASYGWSNTRFISAICAESV